MDRITCTSLPQQSGGSLRVGQGATGRVLVALPGKRVSVYYLPWLILVDKLTSVADLGRDYQSYLAVNASPFLLRLR